MLVIISIIRQFRRSNPACLESNMLGWCPTNDRSPACNATEVSGWSANRASEVPAQHSKDLVHLGEIDTVSCRIAITQDWYGFCGPPEIDGEGVA